MMGRTKNIRKKRQKKSKKMDKINKNPKILMMKMPIKHARYSDMENRNLFGDLRGWIKLFLNGYRGFGILIKDIRRVRIDANSLILLKILGKLLIIC